MPIVVPSVPNRQDPTNPARNAYGVATEFAVNVVSKTGRIRFNLYVSQAAYEAGADPVDFADVAFGEQFPGGHFPSNDELLASPHFGPLYAQVLAGMEQAAIPIVPKLAGATQVGS